MCVLLTVPILQAQPTKFISLPVCLIVLTHQDIHQDRVSLATNSYGEGCSFFLLISSFTQQIPSTGCMAPAFFKVTMQRLSINT